MASSGEYSDYRRYRNGGTSWRGYLTSTGRVDRVEMREALYDALYQAALKDNPDSIYWRDQALASQRAAAALVPDDEVGQSAHDRLPDFATFTWAAIHAGYEGMILALREAAAAGRPPLTAEELAGAFMAAQGGDATPT